MAVVHKWGVAGMEGGGVRSAQVKADRPLNCQISDKGHRVSVAELRAAGCDL